MSTKPIFVWVDNWHDVDVIRDWIKNEHGIFHYWLLTDDGYICAALTANGNSDVYELHENLSYFNQIEYLDSWIEQGRIDDKNLPIHVRFCADILTDPLDDNLYQSRAAWSITLT